jgi:hypothetical protein
MAHSERCRYDAHRHSGDGAQHCRASAHCRQRMRVSATEEGTLMPTTTPLGDSNKFTTIAHSTHRYLSPLSTAKAESLIRRLALAPGKRVLDVGCGKAAFSRPSCGSAGECRRRHDPRSSRRRQDGAGARPKCAPDSLTPGYRMRSIGPAFGGRLYDSSECRFAGGRIRVAWMLHRAVSRSSPTATGSGARPKSLVVAPRKTR